jgi:hypothetical protein
MNPVRELPWFFLRVFIPFSPTGIARMAGGSMRDQCDLGSNLSDLSNILRRRSPV